MRMFVLKQEQDLATLTARITAQGGAAGLERLRLLNPHLELGRRLDLGTVLLVPDDAAEAESVSGAVFDALADDLKQGLKSASERVKSGYAKSDTLRKEVTAAVKTAAFKRVLEGDAELARQIAAADTAAKADKLRAKEADTTLSALDTMVAAELGRLRKLIG